MGNGSPVSLAELDQRIAIVRDNIRQLIEQAAALSGAEDESRNADRIAQQSEELEKLMKQRDELQKRNKVARQGSVLVDSAAKSAAVVVASALSVPGLRWSRRRGSPRALHLSATYDAGLALAASLGVAE